MIANLFQRVRAWPLVLLGSLALLLVLGAATVRESYRGWRVDSEIRAMEEQADALEGRNAKLRELARVLQSPERLEVEARTRLGLRQSGEKVAVLSGLVATGTWQSAVVLDVVEDTAVVERSNPELWLHYFFKEREESLL
jgi:cell division protein FtsB